ncbi:MAG: SAM-dependent methyltransferase, partial [Verrucomicrobiota bacterium]
HRILRPGSTAILTVPQMDPPARTDEDASVLSEPERERRFGQKDHVRMYGDDFIERLRASGFCVEVVTAENIQGGAVDRLCLEPPVISPSPLATNHRRIYFARKTA